MGLSSKQLGFNYTQGALCDGFVANTSIGRFWRLYLRNVAGFLPHKNDKATYGNTWRVVLAENEDVLRKIGWEPTSVEMGFEPGDNTVTIARYTGGGSFSSVSGSAPQEMLPYVAGLSAQVSHVADHVYDEPRQRHAAPAGRAQPDHRRDDYKSRLVEARGEAQFVRQLAFACARV